MNVPETVHALTTMAATLSTCRCMEPALADHIRCELESRRRGHDLAQLTRGDRIKVIAAIMLVEKILDGHTVQR